MKTYLLITGLALTLVFGSCKEGNGVFNRSNSKKKQIERLESENQALRRELDQIEETHTENITNIRSDYEQKLAELQKKIEAGTVAEYDAYYVIVGSFKNRNYAENYAQKVKEMGYEGKVISGPYNFYLVTSGTYENLRASLDPMREAREKVASKAWVYFTN